MLRHIQRRLFSTSATQTLIQAQNAYFKDPKNTENTLNYFKQLNRAGQYSAVVRLFRNEEKNYEGFNAIKNQYTFAADNLISEGSFSSGQITKTSKMNVANMRATLLKNLVMLGMYGAMSVAMIIFVKKHSTGMLLEEKDFSIAKNVETRLEDVKGMDEIRDEIEKVIRMIKDPSRYQIAGAKLHRGILLYGKPGTGKTLLARAIAGQSGVNFIYTSGSDFDEIFVGVGQKRVRQLFKKAREHTPCIIFIDEIDSLINKSRRVFEHSSNRATINQLLSEMDGFKQSQNILVIGATNHEDSLDPAAVRPGRFDKKIHVPLPDLKGRTDIFDLYLAKIAKEDSIKSKKLAQMCPGFSGAQIENLVNTAICRAVNTGKENAGEEEFQWARDRIMMGIERRSLSQSDQERIHTAIHESGHALVSYFNPNAQKVYKATIVARGAALGVTHLQPEQGDMLGMTKEKALAQIDVSMGGHVAQKLFIGNDKITSGCGSDFANATKLAYTIVRHFGMFGEEAGYLSGKKEDQSNEHNALVDRTVKKILDESYERVEKLLREHENDVRSLSTALFTYDYLNKEEIDQVVNGKPLEKKKVRESAKQFVF